eukprot:gene45949-56237_t
MPVPSAREGAFVQRSKEHFMKTIFSGLLAATLTIAATFSAVSARAETLIAAMSSHQIQITSNYTGDQLTVFGLVERDGLVGLEHVDEVLLTSRVPQLRANPVEQVAIERHLEQRGYQARVESFLPGRYRIDYGHEVGPKVSIVVAVRDHLPLLQRCVDSLLEKTRYGHYELLLVDCESQEPATRQWLDGIEALDSEQVKVWRFAGELNYSAMVNAVAMSVESDYLLLLSHDVRIVHEDWLEQLLNHALRPEVGVVGAKVLD